MSLVSIVIPAYNRERVLRNAVESALAQTYQDIEILLVDDGSTDATSQIGMQLADSFPCIRFLKHLHNQGAQAARNSGIKAAQGDWFTFLDSDDELLPESIELRLKKAQQEQVHVVHSECVIIRKNGQKQLFGVSPLSGNIYTAVLAKPVPVFPALLVAREALVRIGLLDERIRAYQEWDTVIRLARYYHFGFVDEPTFIYDCRGNDTMSKNMSLDAAGYEQVFRKHRLEILRNLGFSGLIQHYRFVAERYRLAGHLHDVRRCEQTVRFLSLLSRTLGHNCVSTFVKHRILKRCS